MNIGKGLDGQVDKIIDQAAGVAKEKVGAMIGGGKKDGKAAGGGMGDALSGAIGKAATDAAAKGAADQAMAFGKKLLE